MFLLRRISICQVTKHKEVFRMCCNKAIKGKFDITQKPPPITYGQPTHESHPQLIRKGEVTPLITKLEFQDRRHKLVDQITTYVSGKNPDINQHIVVICSSSKKYMSDKIPYFFRQNSDFLYLTGCLEPDSCLVLTISDLGHCAALFLRDKDEHSELWDGPRTGPGAAEHVFGVEQSLPMSELESYLRNFLKSKKSFTFWYDFMTPIQAETHKIMFDFLNCMPQKMWESPKVFVHRQRLIKSSAEVELMQKSCDIAGKAIEDTIAFSSAGINESQIFAKVDYECRMNGAQYLAYPPVIAGGNRANIIHYINNNQIVQDSEMVLMDAGCEYHGYSSDITRTWPINGKFTNAQRDIYEVVLEVQKHLIKLCEDFPTLDSLFDSMCFELGNRLQKLGVIPKLLTNQALIKAAYQFCPHHVSHYLGMDVHDTSLITRNVNIKPGMIITVEPGVYINHKQKQLPQEFHGLGIRIEDDVLITENGPIVLTRNCAKEVFDIENIASRKES